MSDDCEGNCGSCCSDKDDSGCGGHSCGCCSAPEEVDLKVLGPEAEELAKLFDSVNDNLVAALKSRKEILEMLHKNSASPEMKEKMEKVLRSRHPVLIQFVFGQ